jgi:hypothetical protein
LRSAGVVGAAVVVSVVMVVCPLGGVVPGSGGSSG